MFGGDETHPAAEITASSDRIGIGGPTVIAAGCRCATLSVDRTNLYDAIPDRGHHGDDTRYAAGATCGTRTSARHDSSQRLVEFDPFPGVR